jgi:hypothetical protein
VRESIGEVPFFRARFTARGHHLIILFHEMQRDYQAKLIRNVLYRSSGELLDVFLAAWR